MFGLKYMLQAELEIIDTWPCYTNIPMMSIGQADGVCIGTGPAVGALHLIQGHCDDNASLPHGNPLDAVNYGGCQSSLDGSQ